MEGTSRIQCDANGRWSTQAPFCRQGAYATISPTFSSSFTEEVQFFETDSQNCINLSECISIDPRAKLNFCAVGKTW